MNGRRFYEGPPAADARRSAPAALRNREPIAEVLANWLPENGTVLEVASGTGEHAAWFAERFPNLDWQPSDMHPDALASIEAWRAASGASNIKPPIALDASAGAWPIERADAVLNINRAHISPWAASLGLIAGAARILPEGGTLILYGPWFKDDIGTAPSNLAFDADLKARDPQWGLRRVEDFHAAAAARGFELAEWHPMPANNLMLLFRLTSSQRT
jgi:SAM-dependent methyltransferase